MSQFHKNESPKILTHNPSATKNDIKFVSDLIQKCLKKPSKQFK